MEHSNCEQPMAKKSLMNALENLESKARNLRDLADFSDRVITKLVNPRPQPEPDNGCGIDKAASNEPIPDLVDLFNKVAERIDTATKRIGLNTEKINSFIE